MPRPARPSRPAPELAEPKGPSSVWPALVGLLLTARYLQPTEGAVFGETLWQAQLWLAAAAAWCWFAIKAGRATFRWSLLDAFVWLLVLGHGLSMIPVFVEGGDRRAAVNVFWEWAGLAATVFLVRQVLDGSGLRRALVALAAAMVAMAALGVWQHHVSFPATAAKYSALKAELAKYETDEGPLLLNREQWVALQRELAELGMPQDAASQRRWEDRLTSSSEPFGTFALANTLAGLLVAAIAVVVGRGVTLQVGRKGADAATAIVGTPSPPAPLRRERGVRLVGLLSTLGLLLYCLILTKSRTAWVGLAAGAIAAGALHLWRGKLNRRVIAFGAAGAGGVLLLGLIVLATGGLDRAVFSEAPKSLRFRLDYWVGALGVLSERPLLGTGAGNFRSYYLEHRPEGASEAVAAPHNLFLDAWTAGGLLSLVALIGLLAYVAFRFISVRDTDAEEEPARTAEEREKLGPWGGLEWGFVAAFPAAMLVVFLGQQGIDWRIAGMCPVGVAALLVLSWSNGRARLGVASGAGFCAVVVHLLGADGIEFPAVVQTLLLLALPADRPREGFPLPARGFGVFGVFALFAAGCLLMGVRPVLNAGALTARADGLMERGDPAADRALAEAGEADPLATGPPVRRAELATARALSTRSATDFEAAEQRWREVLVMQPRDIHARKRLAELLLARPAAADESSAETATDLLAEAVRLSPTEAGLYLELARAAAKAGRAVESRRAATEAMRLDQINRAAGHADLVFDAKVRDELARLAAAGNGEPVP
jgi:O-antigen ligase